MEAEARYQTPQDAAYAAVEKLCKEKGLFHVDGITVLIRWIDASVAVCGWVAVASVRCARRAQSVECSERAER